MSHRDPDARCATCGARLSRVDRDHEERCGREAAGWPAFEEEPIHADHPVAARRGAGDAAGTEAREGRYAWANDPSGPNGSGGAGVAESADAKAVRLGAPATNEAHHAA